MTWDPDLSDNPVPGLKCAGGGMCDGSGIINEWRPTGGVIVVCMKCEAGKAVAAAHFAVFPEIVRPWMREKYPSLFD